MGLDDNDVSVLSHYRGATVVEARQQWRRLHMYGDMWVKGNSVLTNFVVKLKLLLKFIREGE